MNRKQELWKSYSLISKLLKDELGRTSNIVGEYAEDLIKDYVGGELLPASSKSADIKSSQGKLYQVKSRVIKGKMTGTLGTIRSWDFDYLATIIFDEYGNVTYAGIISKNDAKEFSNYTEHQNGNVISLSQKFINDKRNINITNAIKKINLQEVDETNVEIKQEISKIPIGKYVRLKLNEIVKKGLINQDEIEKLQENTYSKTTFDIQYPFLKKVINTEKQRPERYWRDIFTINDQDFYICCEWYENKNNNDRPYFETWLNKFLNK